MYFVYMVRCEDASLYTGMTSDLHRRMREHQNRQSRGARYTKSHPVTALEAAWQTQTRSDALRLEALIKRLPRADKLLLAASPETVYAVFGEKLAEGEFQPVHPEELFL